MSGSSLRVDDRRLERLKREIAKKAQLKVGVFGDKAAARAVDSPTTVGVIAESHEFGLGPPQRSWLREYADEAETRIRRALDKAALAVYQQKVTLEQAYDLLGHKIVGEIKQRIVAGIAPGLSERYKPRKAAKYPGATTPLIASGQFLASITHEVETGGEK